jgi:hypothetical protein
MLSVCLRTETKQKIYKKIFFWQINKKEIFRDRQGTSEIFPQKALWKHSSGHNGQLEKQFRFKSVAEAKKVLQEKKMKFITLLGDSIFR